MKAKNYLLVIFLLVWGALACNLGALFAPTSTPPPPEPTSTSPEEPAATPTTLAETPGSTPEEAVPPPREGLEVIFISQPGPNSQVTSPVFVMGEADSTFEQNLVVMVTGEDGGQLALEPTIIQAPLGERGVFSIEIAFSVGVEQPGRISVYSTSALDGGIVHLSSAEVVLLPGGAASLTTNSDEAESIAIFSPGLVETVSGGALAVDGFSDYYFESSLGMALCGAGGSGSLELLCGTVDNTLAMGPAMIDSPDIGLPGPFSGELSYSISEPTPARLLVYAASPRDGGLIHVSSVPIQLQP